MTRKSALDISYSPHRIERSSGRAGDSYSTKFDVGRVRDVGDVATIDQQAGDKFVDVVESDDVAADFICSEPCE